MSDPFTDGDEAATPLAPEERTDLIPAYITTREDLNAAEQDNILQAVKWLGRARRRRDSSYMLTESFLLELHKRMFKKVWRWAGSYRVTDKNIGIICRDIPIATRHLLDDAKAWLQYKSYDPDELAVRFHHRLVFIHPFPNGNGRHARLMADILVTTQGQPGFSWGGRRNLSASGSTRADYLEALRKADEHDFEYLISFARS